MATGAIGVCHARLLPGRFVAFVDTRSSAMLMLVVPEMPRRGASLMLAIRARCSPAELQRQ